MQRHFVKTCTGNIRVHFFQGENVEKVHTNVIVVVDLLKQVRLKHSMSSKGFPDNFWFLINNSPSYLQLILRKWLLYISFVEQVSKYVPCSVFDPWKLQTVTSPIPCKCVCVCEKERKYESEGRGWEEGYKPSQDKAEKKIFHVFRAFWRRGRTNVYQLYSN